MCKSNDMIDNEVNSFKTNHIWNWNIQSNNRTEKTLQLICGDLCELQQECDVVVCSAFKNDYLPTPSSLIGSLARKKDIWIEDLSQYPELDFRNIGCWLSHETGTSFRRVACVELLDYPHQFDSDDSINLLIKRTFSTLRFLLEQADILKLPIKVVALPILGTGDQDIDETYILATLIFQCQTILKTNSGVDKIILYELNEAKAQRVAHSFNEVFSEKKEKEKVFLSYSSKQANIADEIYETFRDNNIPCWMAHVSIPAGSDYTDEIPIAISQAEIAILLLTPDAEKSKWVKKEINTAIGANKIIIPYLLNEYPISDKFIFLLNGEQIMKATFETSDKKYMDLLNRVKEILENS